MGGCHAAWMNESETRFSFADILGENMNLRKSISIAQKAAKTDVKLLLQGNTGTGKEVFAQAIHNESSRSATGRFVAINCSAIPNEIIESEMFGYEYGAFTGAKRGGHMGIFELAQGGTLFLDEISELSLEAQAKLLRAIEEKRIRRIGGHKIIDLDVRIICATNKNLLDFVKIDKFRDDLYYRLCVVVINIPPLCERKDDIPELINFFVSKYAQKLNRQIKHIHERTKHALCNYNWPGNIRELKNVIEQAVLFCDGDTLLYRHLPESIFDCSNASSSSSYRLPTLTLHELERTAIEQAINKSFGNMSKAANLLGIGRTTLYRKVKEFKIINVYF